MLKYENLKKNALFSVIKRNITSNDTITVFVRHVRSLSRHIDDIASDYRTKNNDIIGFTEIKISQSDSTCKIIEMLKFFNINFSNNKNKFTFSFFTYEEMMLLPYANLMLMEYLFLVSRNMLLPTEYTL